MRDETVPAPCTGTTGVTGTPVDQEGTREPITPQPPARDTCTDSSDTHEAGEETGSRTSERQQSKGRTSVVS
jgi:hypothetical protein